MAGSFLSKTGLEYLWGKLKHIFGVPEERYTQVEWVESNGKQFVYLDWKPPIATWGFEADFIIRNAFNSKQAAWDPDLNVNNSGFLFGTLNVSGVNDIELGTYSSDGFFRIGNGTDRSAAIGMKTDKSRQTIKFIGNTVTKPDGSTTTLTRPAETAGKFYANMTVFAYHSGLRRYDSGTVSYPSTTRIYSLKFYEGTTVVVDLVGAVRKKDGVTGLYDKINKHFYSAPGMSYGDAVGNLGDVDTILETTDQTVIPVTVNNLTDRRMWEGNAPALKRLEDGQKLCVTPMYTVVASMQTEKLAGWNDTGTNSYVYLKLTLADGSVTDWIPCYYQGKTRLTTQYGSGDPINFTYRENAFIDGAYTSAGSAVMRGFWADPNYNTNTDTTKIKTTYEEAIHTHAGTYGMLAYSLVMEDSEGRLQSLTTTGGTGTDKVKNPSAFRLHGIYYVNITAAITEGNLPSSESYLYDGFNTDFRYSSNCGTTLTIGKFLYLVGTIGTDGYFYLDDTWWTQDLPTTEDGKVYIYLGSVYSTTGLQLARQHPIFEFKNGRIRHYIPEDTITSSEIDTICV